MNSPNQQPESTPSRPVPRTAVVFMLIVVVALALVALFANVQRFRRDKIETVIVRPAPPPTPIGQ